MVNIKDSDEAVVGIVVAVLLIGLAISVTVMVNNVYVPQWLEEAEAAHMEQVASQFAQLKYAIDLQSLIQQRTAISASVTLGIKDLPILGVGKTFGTIEINEQQCVISVENTTNSWNYTVGQIKFSSGNSYFVRQQYIYESGALILNQKDEGSMLIGRPMFLADFDGVYFTVINITTSESKSSVGGYGTYPIHVEFVKSQHVSVDNVTKITVISDYPNAWATAFKNTFKRSDNPYDESIVRIEGNKVVVDFTSSGVSNNVLDLKYVEIYAQVAPGWIE